MRPRKKKWRKLIFTIIFLFISILSFNKIYDDFKIAERNDKINKLINAAQEMQINTYNDGTTYYVASNGTSADGTNIDDPMSIETANKKTYYGNDKVLLKKGDTFYGIIQFNVNANENNLFYIGSYGSETEEMPIITTSIYVDNENAWSEFDENIYRLDLSNRDYINGYYTTSTQLYNIGFFRDEKDNIFGNKKSNLDSLINNFDFYCENNYIYVKAEENPTKLLGKITFATRNNIVYIYSNTILDGIVIKDTGAHGVTKGEKDLENVIITSCIIQNIGGSYHSGTTRYGNGIEFFNQSSNTIIENCIFKNIYDAAYTLQGTAVTNGFYNNVCRNNIFIKCTYPFEFSCHNNYNTDGVDLEGTIVENNIIIDQARGWGYEVRDDKYQPANIVSWTIPENSGEKNTFKNNRCYNSRALYYKSAATTVETYKEAIEADFNTYYLNNDTIFFIDTSTHKDMSILDEYGFDQNSTFNYLSDAEIEEISNPDILNSNDYNEIKAYYDAFDIKYRNSHATTELLTSLGEVLGKTEYANILQNSTINAQYEELQNAINNLCQNIDIINSDSVSYTYECLYNLISTITSEYYNSKLANISEETLISLIEDLDNVSDKYKEIYSYYIANDNIDLTTVKNTLNNAINKYNDNLDLDIGKLETIITTAKDLYNNSITTENVSENILNKQRIINISNIANNIIDTKIAKVIEEEKSLIKVEYDKDINTPTNESITATITVGDHTTITNNGGSNKHKFDQNGTFTFELDIKGIKVSVQVTISNINKEYTIEQGYITNIVKNTQILNFKDNLGISNFTISRNGQTININEDVVATGDVLKFDNKEYVLIVCGDINSDGDCGIHDLVSYRKYLLDYAQYDNIRQMAADINQDKVLDIKDLVGIRKIVLD